MRHVRNGTEIAAGDADAVRASAYEEGGQSASIVEPGDFILKI